MWLRWWPERTFSMWWLQSSRLGRDLGSHVSLRPCFHASDTQEAPGYVASCFLALPPQYLMWPSGTSFHFWQVQIEAGWPYAMLISAPWTFHPMALHLIWDYKELLQTSSMCLLRWFLYPWEAPLPGLHPQLSPVSAPLQRYVTPLLRPGMLRPLLLAWCLLFYFDVFFKKCPFHNSIQILKIQK